MTDGDDKAFADNQMRLAVSGLSCEQLSCPQHEEQHVVVDFQFGALMCVVSVLNHEFVEPKLCLDEPEQLLIGLVQAEPNDATLLSRERRQLLDVDVAHAMAVAI